ncbi:hypothetical protein P22_2871 [Propionispora sp. 2/2-37]|nr:hypothetical protein P22_2871 [Propionispora sp. 2/2-37]
MKTGRSWLDRSTPGEFDPLWTMKTIMGANFSLGNIKPGYDMQPGFIIVVTSGASETLGACSAQWLTKRIPLYVQPSAACGVLLTLHSPVQPPLTLRAVKRSMFSGSTYTKDINLKGIFY